MVSDAEKVRLVAEAFDAMNEWTLPEIFDASDMARARRTLATATRNLLAAILDREPTEEEVTNTMGVSQHD